VVEYHFTITIENSAGETVATLTSGTPAASNPGSDFSLNTGAFDPAAGQSAVILAGGQSFTWLGNNSGGQGVQNGSYMVTLTTTDQFGQTQTMTKSVSVISSGTTYTLQIFNSAGEIVDTITTSNYGGTTGSGNNAPSQLVPNKTSIVVGSNDPADAVVSFNLGTGNPATNTLNWTGVNSQGQQVASGSYLAELTVTHPGAAPSKFSASLTVLQTNSNLFAGALLGPNPLNMSNGGSGILVLKMNLPAGTVVLGRLYDLAGELVTVATNNMNPNYMTLNIGERKTASGIYILLVQANAPWGTVQRQTFKVVIIR
jgi:flagellar hook assembly protein FlgD